METATNFKTLTNAQIEILKMFNIELSDNEILKLKKLLANFLNEITTLQISELETAGKFPTANELVNAHLRTPYI